MAFNFPANPSDGDTYEGYVYDSIAGVWNSIPSTIGSTGGGFVASATAPENPSEGDGWFDTNTAKSYIFYDGFWVQIGANGTLSLGDIGGVSIASPANGESLVYNGTDWVNQNVTVEPTEIYDVSTTSVGKFALPAGTTAERPATPNSGDIRFNTETKQPEWYLSDNDAWYSFRETPAFGLEYIVIAGGGGGGYYWGGGGGAGGYRSSITGENSGGGGLAETPIAISSGLVCNVTIGSGGAASGATGSRGGNGSNSIFNNITAIGGGGGGSRDINTGASGGSGGGGSNGGAGGSGTSLQGFSGATAVGSEGGGGGGAAGAGFSSPLQTGGAGLYSSATGVSVGRAGGGTGHNEGVAGEGGGSYGQNATVNTGGGGGGDGGAGGSGIVILKYPGIYSINVSAGLTSSTSTVGSDKVTQISSGTGTVTFS